MLNLAILRLMSSIILAGSDLQGEREKERDTKITTKCCRTHYIHKFGVVLYLLVPKIEPPLPVQPPT